MDDDPAEPEDDGPVERFNNWFPVRAAPPPAPQDPERRARIRRWAQGILAAESRWMILDTETTGFDRSAEIIEVAAVTPRGETLFDTLIRPGGRIPADITALTGIAEKDVVGSPSFREVWEQLLATHCGSRAIIAYNAPFDIRMLQQNVQRHCGQMWAPLASDCLMRAYARYRGERQRGGAFRCHKLGAACAQMGIAHDHAHRALDDCRVSAQLLRALAQ